MNLDDYDIWVWAIEEEMAWWAKINHDNKKKDDDQNTDNFHYD